MLTESLAQINQIFLINKNINRSLSAAQTGRTSRWVLPKFLELPKHQRGRPCLSTENGRYRDYPHGVRDQDGIIIVDHGSRRKESNLMLNEFVAMFTDETGYQIVEPAHMELAEPSIRDAFASCIQQGANRVIVSPFFLFPGRHWHQDIPSLTANAAKEYPGVPYIITAPLGLHELLVDVVNDRIKHCLSHVEGDIDECAVCAGTQKCRLH
ncbi:sirohydrochlorin ferrochelatase, chloroplastic [Carica papaya]|uniref:sirohydrochlorin ferrochelatase, chloroplastic n=1 Tax=Carica papaya TaxID=3649 RepID=UPI000B8CC42F|nr:sirohydrochlorin ferrochelatase, chloroplastic [Carica papaya]